MSFLSFESVHLGFLGGFMWRLQKEPPISNSKIVHTTYCFAIIVDAKSALNAKHTASRTKLTSHVHRAKDVPVNFS
jgi:hypothetical protein